MLGIEVFIISFFILSCMLEIFYLKYLNYKIFQNQEKERVSNRKLVKQMLVQNELLCKYTKCFIFIQYRMMTIYFIEWKRLQNVMYSIISYVHNIIYIRNVKNFLNDCLWLYLDRYLCYFSLFFDHVYFYKYGKTIKIVF